MGSGVGDGVGARGSCAESSLTCGTRGGTPFQGSVWDLGADPGRCPGLGLWDAVGVGEWVVRGGWLRRGVGGARGLRSKTRLDHGTGGVGGTGRLRRGFADPWHPGRGVGGEKVVKSVNLTSYRL